MPFNRALLEGKPVTLRYDEADPFSSLYAALHEGGALTKAGVASLSDAVLDAALTLGSRSAAVTVSRAGANPPWRNEL